MSATEKKPALSKTHPAYRYRKAGPDETNTQINSDGVKYVTVRFETAEDEADAEALAEGQQYFNNPLLKAEKPNATAADIVQDFETQISTLKEEKSALAQSNKILTVQVKQLTEELADTNKDLDAVSKELDDLKADPKVAKLLK